MSFSLGDTLTPHALMADKDPPSLTPPEGYTLVAASRVIEQAGMSYRAFPLLRGCPKGGGFRRVYLCLRFAFPFLPSFSLMRSKRRIKAKMNGPPHSRPKCLTLRSRSAFSEGKRQAPLREGQAFSSSLGRPPLPFWPGPRAQPNWVLAFPSTVSVVIASIPNAPTPLPSFRT